MDAELDLALTTGLRLAKMYRVVGDHDLRSELPDVAKVVRLRALDRLRNDGVLHRRAGRVGFSSTIYAGCVDEHGSGRASTA
jgi:hypothetical protein